MEYVELTAEDKNNYDEHLTNHREAVKSALAWIQENLPELINQEIFDKLTTNIYNHDISKYSVGEYEPYAQYFYGKASNSKKARRDFEYAWNAHQKANPHHWQYWVLLRDDAETMKLLDIPEEYLIEMICDWWSFSWMEGNLYEIFDWYKKHKSTIRLSVDSRKKCEDILKKIENKLEELDKEKE